MNEAIDSNELLRFITLNISIPTLANSTQRIQFPQNNKYSDIKYSHKVLN